MPGIDGGLRAILAGLSGLDKPPAYAGVKFSEGKENEKAFYC
jgi:hypothetical protein